MTNSIDTDQALRFAASDLCLHCLRKPVYPNSFVLRIKNDNCIK